MILSYFPTDLTGAIQTVPVAVADPHTQIAAGLEQFVILTRVTFRLQDTDPTLGQ
jgi:hypothetical protein